MTISSSVLAMVPVTWSRFLGAEEVQPFLSAFAPKAKRAGAVGTGPASAACGVSLEAVLQMVKRSAGGSMVRVIRARVLERPRCTYQLRKVHLRYECSLCGTEC